jgi:hypothetical protein
VKEWSGEELPATGVRTYRAADVREEECAVDPTAHPLMGRANYHAITYEDLGDLDAEAAQAPDRQGPGVLRVRGATRYIRTRLLAAG